MKNVNGANVAGIGGYTKTMEGDHMFIFSGPCEAKSLLEAETMALLTLMGVIHTKIHHDEKSSSIQIHITSGTTYINIEHAF